MEKAEKSIPSYLKDAPEEIKLKVEKLIDLAWHKGVAAAVKEARAQGPLILDAFHDALAYRMHNELKKRE